MAIIENCNTISEAMSKITPSNLIKGDRDATDRLMFVPIDLTDAEQVINHISMADFFASEENDIRDADLREEDEKLWSFAKHTVDRFETDDRGMFLLGYFSEMAQGLGEVIDDEEEWKQLSLREAAKLWLNIIVLQQKYGFYNDYDDLPDNYWN